MTTLATIWSRPTLSPTLTVSSVTVPSTGAASESSIFIDSSTTIVWPASTVSPALTGTSRTEPGIGARSSPSACA